MPVFMSENATQTGGRSPKPAVRLTCGSYTELERLANASTRAGVRAAWYLPDLDEYNEYRYNAKGRIEGVCRTDEMPKLKELITELYDRDTAIAEVPQVMYDLQLHMLRRDVWSMCNENHDPAAEKWLTAKGRWLLGVYHDVSDVFHLHIKVLEDDGVDEDLIDDLKNLVDRIENLDQSHWARLNKGDRRVGRRKKQF
jgi:hypothetical protein